MKRQQSKERKTNSLLLDQYLTLLGEQRSATGWQKVAAGALCLESFKKLCSAMNKLDDYQVSLNGVQYQVQRRHSDAPPRIFQTVNSRCTCEERVAFLGTCVHELAIRNFCRLDVFCINMFHLRHQQRSAVTQASDVSHVTEASQDNLFPTLDDNPDEGDDAIDISDQDEVSISTPFDRTEKPNIKKGTFAQLRNACLDCVNACIRWKNQDVAKMFLGMISHTMDVMMKPKVTDANWRAENVDKYVNSFAHSCVAKLTTLPVITGAKRKLFQSDYIAKRKKTRSCGKCGEALAFDTGHHTAATCAYIQN